MINDRDIMLYDKYNTKRYGGHGMKIDKDWIIIAVLFVIIGFLSVQLYKLNTKAEI